MSHENPIDKAISAAGGLTELGRLIERSPQVISNWRARGVPAEHCPAIERATAGAVRCEDLRPDVDWAYLRGTDCPQECQHQKAA